MKASKFSEAQKAFILKQGAEGVSVADICRKAGISQATYCNWKKKYDGMTPPEMRRLRQLEDENAKLRKLVAHASVEGLAEAVLNGPARGDVVPVDARRLSPCEHGVGGELRAVVADDEPRFAATPDDLVEFADNPSSRDRGVRDRAEAFLGDVVEDVENAKAPARTELVVDEVERPAGIRRRRDEDRRPRAHGSFAAAATADRKAFLAIEALRLLPVHDVPFAAQQYVQPPVAETALLARQFAQPQAQIVIRRSAGSVADHLPVGLDDVTRPPLAHLVGIGERGDSFALGGGRHHFFERRSFSATLSSMASAKSRFSLAFSSSSALSRLASDTSIPPNFAFQA